MEHPVDFETLQKKADRRTRIQKTVIYFFLTVWALIVLFPFYWMVLTSVKSYSAYNAEHVPAFLPSLPLSRTMWMLLLRFPLWDTC